MKYIILTLSILLFYKTYAQVATPQIDNNPINRRLVFLSEEHINNFINYYTNSSEENALENVVNRLEHLGFKSLTNEKLKLQELTQHPSEHDNDIEEDEFIGDGRFACLLNRKREIIIGEMLYKYEANGAFFTPVNQEHILSSKIQKTKNDSNTSTSKKSISNTKDSTTYDLGDNVSFFEYDYKRNLYYEDDFNIESNSTKGSTNTTNSSKLELKNCNFDNSGFIESLLPGSSEKCTVHINNNKRIRTVFSNQNYKVFSSVYAKVKSQERKEFLGVEYWKKENFCEFLELGRTVNIRYPVEIPTPNLGIHNFLIKDNNFDRVIDREGNTLPVKFHNPSSLFDDFPFKKESFNYEIYLYVSNIDITPKSLNDFIEDQVENLLKTVGRSFDDLFEKGEKIGITIDSPKGIFFSEFGARTRKYGTSKIEKIYDLNFIIKFKSSGTDGGIGKDAIDFFKSARPRDNAKTYDILTLDVVGYGMYNDNIYGSRIHKGDLFEENSNDIDTDGDGVVDSEDFCRFQPGNKQYGGCPYQLIENQTIFANRVNKYINNAKSNQKFGSCGHVILSASDYPSLTKTISGGAARKYQIVAGESIAIKRGSNLIIKPANNTISICLKTDQNACNITPITSTSLSNKQTTTSKVKATDENILRNITLHPNPTTGLITVNSSVGIQSWILYNTLGATYKQGSHIETNSFNINLNDYSNGIYILKLQLDDGTIVSKQIIKQ